MPDGATQVGSITGNMDLNLDQWIRAVARIKADVDELERLDADVRVTASTARAEEQIAVVDAAAGELDRRSVNVRVGTTGADAAVAAEARLAAAVTASDTATARAQIAEMRLNELRDRGARSAAELASAELALTVAIDRSETAATQAAHAEEALAAAQTAAAATAGREAAAQDSAGASTRRTNESIFSSITANKAQAVGIAALIVAIAPLVAMATALAGAFVLEGAAGAAAVIGIKNEMAAGTQTGQAYSAGLQELKGDLDQLASTGANAMLSEFQSAQKDIGAYMPTLNQDVAVFAGYLGRSGNELLDAALKALITLNPLLIDGAEYIQRVAGSLNDFAGSSDFQGFVTYAQAELPQVERLLGNVVETAIHLGAAFAPVGQVLIAVLNGVTSAIDAIPVPVLQGAAGAALGVGAAFLTWNFITATIAGVSAAAQRLAVSNVAVAATSAAAAEGEVAVAGASVAAGSAMAFALGPIGLAAAAAGALGAILLGTAASSNTAATATANYTAALQADSGALGENVRAQAAKALSDAGAYDIGLKLGISQKTLTDATLGNADAQKQAQQAIKENGQETVKLVGGAGQASVATKGLSNEALDLQKTLGAQTGAVKESVRAYQNQQAALHGSEQAATAQARSLGVSQSAYLAASDAAHKHADQTKNATLQMRLEGDAAGLLQSSLDKLNGKVLGVAEAQTAFASASNSAAKTLTDSKGAIDGNSEAAVASQQAIQQNVEAAQRLAEATSKATGSTAAGTKSLQDSKVALENNLKATGNLTPAVQAYIDKIYAIPKTAPTTAEIQKSAAEAAIAAYKGAIASIPALHKTAVSADTAAANAAINTLIRNIANIPGYKAVVIDQQIRQTGAAPGAVKAAYNAHGGTAERFATGGTSGSVWGSAGSATSDKVPTWLSIGEEVTQTAAASYPGVRPMLKAINADPAGTMQALSRGQQSSGDVKVFVTNKSGISLDDLVEIHVEKANKRTQVALSAGRQNASY